MAVSCTAMLQLALKGLPIVYRFQCPLARHIEDEGRGCHVL